MFSYFLLIFILSDSFASDTRKTNMIKSCLTELLVKDIANNFLMLYFSGCRFSALTINESF